MKSTRTVNGYTLVYEPDYASSMKGNNWDGYVYEHILIAEKKLGRVLREDECVHHLDFDRSNNHPINLLVLLKSEHLRLHEWLSKYDLVLKKESTKNLTCKVCGDYITTNGSKYYCSIECSALEARRYERPSKEELHKLLWSKSTTQVASDIGCSDKCIQKWCNTYGLTKPPRGFWQQLQVNKMLGQCCPLPI